MSITNRKPAKKRLPKYECTNCGYPAWFEGCECRSCYNKGRIPDVKWEKSEHGIKWKQEYMKKYNREYRLLGITMGILHINKQLKESNYNA